MSSLMCLVPVLPDCLLDVWQDKPSLPPEEMGDVPASLATEQ